MDKRAPTGLILEHDPSSATTFDIIFIHGVHGKTPSVESLLGHVPDTSGRVLFFKYNSDDPHRTYTRAWLDSQAVLLIQQVRELCCWDSTESQRAIVLFGHDFGGTVLKKAVTLAYANPIAYSAVLKRLRSIVFYGCPHRWTDAIDLEQQLVRLLQLGRPRYGRTPVRLARTLAGLVHYANAEFILSPVLLQIPIVNVFSESPNLEEGVFHEETPIFGISAECSQPIKTSHLDLLESDYPIIRNPLLERGSVAPIQAASPIFPRSLNHQTLGGGSIRGVETIIDRTLLGKEHGLLYIYASRWVGWEGDFIFQHLHRHTKPKLWIIHFQFRRGDCRFNTAHAFLATIITQMARDSRLPEMERTMQNTSDPETYSREYLFRIWTDLRATGRIDAALYLICGLDECADGDWLLSNLLTYMDNVDTPGRFIVLSGIPLSQAISSVNFESETVRIVDVSKRQSDSAGPSSEMVGPSIPIIYGLDLHSWQAQRAPKASCGSESQFEEDLAILFQDRPQLSFFEEAIRKCFDGTESCSRLHRAVFNWLRYTGDNCMQVGNHLREICRVTSSTLSQVALAVVPESQQPWVRTVLNWLVSSFHPPSIGELLPILVMAQSGIHELPPTLPSAATVDDLPLEFLQYFGGLVEFRHGEIVLLTPPHAVDSPERWHSYPSRGARHEEITRACLAHLSSQSVRETLDQQSQGDLVDIELCQKIRTFTTYAVRYWPDHYKLACQDHHSEDLVGKVTEFLKDPERREPWRLAFFAHHRKLEPDDREDLGLLGVIAGLGLDRHLINDVGRCAVQAEDVRGFARAVKETMRGGYVQTLEALVEMRGSPEWLATFPAALDARFYPNGPALVPVLLRDADYHASPVSYGAAIRLACHYEQMEILKTMMADPNLSSETQGRWLRVAATHNLVPAMKMFCDSGMHPMSVHEGDQPLHIAAAYGALGVVDVLISAGADVFTENEDGLTVLEIACTHGFHRIVERLLLEACSKGSYAKSYQPLLTSIVSGHDRCLAAVLKRLELSENPTMASMAIRWAADENKVSMTRLLLEAGASPNISLNEAETTYSPLHGAARWGHSQLVDLLLEFHANVDELDRADGTTPLCIAASNGHLAIVRSLLQAGADFNTRANEDIPILNIVAESGDTETAQLLLDAGADPELHEGPGLRALHRAHEHPKVVSLLLARGVDVNAESTNGSPLLLACSSGVVEVVKLLLAHDPKPNVNYKHEPSGDTPLSVAIDKEATDIVGLLLEAGADVNLQVKSRLSPLASAVNLNRDHEVRLLLEYGADLQWKDPRNGLGVMNYLSAETSVLIIQRLINRGVSPEFTDNSGNTPIWPAVMFENTEVVRYLAKVVKVNVNPKGNINHSLLHHACEYANPEIIKILVDAGADVNLDSKTLRGTPLQIACFRKTKKPVPHETIEIMQYLIDRGARIDMPVGTLRSVLNNACLSSTFEVVEFLIQLGADTSVVDEFGRTAAHLVSYRSLAHYQKLNPSEDALVALDRMNRTALHYAAVSGDKELMKTILEVYKRRPNLGEDYTKVVDIDGWTLLHWAARSASLWGSEPFDPGSVIEYLIEEGFDLTAKAKSMDQEWIPLDVAIYHAADDKIKELLTPPGPQSLYATEERPGKKYDLYCDVCFLEICGFHMACLTCDFQLCFKCQRLKELLHPDHEFLSTGPEYDSEDELEPADPYPQPDDQCTPQ